MVKGYGGKREGAGRKPGSKSTLPKNTSKIEGKEVDNEESKAVAVANKKFIEGLSGDMKKLYAGFSKRHKLPLDDLKQLATSMKARYNIGLQSEIQEHGVYVKLAKEEILEIEQTGLVHGNRESTVKRNNRLRKLKSIVFGKYHISSSLTTLSAELKNVFVEIERIEAGQPKGNVNIFHFLKGEGDKKKIDALEEGLFSPDEELSNQLRRDADNDN